MKLELVKCVVRLMSGRDVFFLLLYKKKKKYCTGVHITKKKRQQSQTQALLGELLTTRIKSVPLNKSLQSLQN